MNATFFADWWRCAILFFLWGLCLLVYLVAKLCPGSISINTKALSGAAIMSFGGYLLGKFSSGSGLDWAVGWIFLCSGALIIYFEKDSSSKKRN